MLNFETIMTPDGTSWADKNNKIMKRNVPCWKRCWSLKWSWQRTGHSDPTTRAQPWIRVAPTGKDVRLSNHDPGWHHSWTADTRSLDTRVWWCIIDCCISKGATSYGYERVAFCTLEEDVNLAILVHSILFSLTSFLRPRYHEDVKQYHGSYKQLRMHCSLDNAFTFKTGSRIDWNDRKRCSSQRVQNLLLLLLFAPKWKFKF